MRLALNYRMGMDVEDFETAGRIVDAVGAGLEAALEREGVRGRGAPSSLDLGSDCGATIGDGGLPDVADDEIDDQPRMMRGELSVSPLHAEVGALRERLALADDRAAAATQRALAAESRLAERDADGSTAPA